MTYLILDATYLCHRAFYAFPELRNGTDATGVLYGFLRDLVLFKDTHNTNKFIFCFDCGRSKRHKDFDGYKGNRKHPEREQAARDDFSKQMEYLRTAYLPQLGYRNILYSSGYEADDIIASVVSGLNKDDEAIIISSDHDMFQLLSDRVCMWLPSQKKAYTVASLKKQYGVEPIQWPHVKSLAGCSSDSIPGCPGVGEITAAKYLTGKLSSKLKTYQAIEDFARSPFRKRNYDLVKLPYPGTPAFTLQEDDVTDAKWRAVCKKLGMKSLLRSSPLLTGDGEKQGFLFD